MGRRRVELAGMRVENSDQDRWRRMAQRETGRLAAKIRQESPDPPAHQRMARQETRRLETGFHLVCPDRPAPHLLDRRDLWGKWEYHHWADLRSRDRGRELRPTRAHGGRLWWNAMHRHHVRPANVRRKD